MARKKKTLLSEGEIRQFMKLANLGRVTDRYINENYMEEQEEEDIGMEISMDEPAPEPAPEEMPMDDEMGDEMGDEGMEAEGLVADLASVLQQWVEEHGGDMSIESDEDALEGGEEEVAVDAEMEVGPEGDEMAAAEVEMEEEPGMRDMYEERIVAEIVRRLREKEKDWGHGKHQFKRSKNPKTGRESKTGEGPEGHYKDYEGPEGGNKGDESETHPGRKDYEKKDESVDSEEDIVNEVAKRVARRLAAQEQKEKTVDTLAERIMQRLTDFSKR